MDFDFTTVEGIALAILAGLDLVFALFPSLKSNSVVDFILNILKKLAGKSE